MESAPTFTPSAVAGADGDPLIALEGVYMAFGGTVALRGETFRVWPGEIVGLLGHNGAGKSTLVNVATGALRPQRGKMKVRGQEVALRGDPRQMEHLGVKVIHQDPSLASNLSICDNITLGRGAERRSRRRRREAAQEALALLGSDLAPDRPVESLEFGQRQIVALARAVSESLSVLFLDEPTGALGQHEVDELHDLIRRLADEGRGIVYVSHRLRDIVAVCTRIVVLREGRIVLDGPTSDFTVADLSEALAPGFSAPTHHARHEADSSDIVLTARHWGGQEVCFAHGEIVGLFGMAAGPQFRFLDALFGLAEPPDAQLQGQPFSPSSPAAAIRRRVYYVSGDRERDGLVTEMSALDNLVLPWLRKATRYSFLSRSKSRRMYEQAEEALNIRGARMDAPVGAFSGGNRQKVVVGRWLFGGQPDVLLLSQPTQGVDVGARVDIARALRQLAGHGVTILVASSEADEIALLCDRALICEGYRWMASARTESWEESLLAGLIARAAA